MYSVMPQSSNEDQSALSRDQIRTIEFVINIFTKLVSAIGLPGTVLLFCFLYLIKYTTSEQKTEIIDKYVLFKDGTGVTIFILFLVFLSLSLFFYYRRSNKSCNSRVLDLKKQVEDYQELLKATIKVD